MMRRAFALAGRGQGRVEPNPMVGCVIVRNGDVIGEGYHRRFGGAHAEIEALRACAVDPRGATAYVSLEPCRHRGKTPPCTDALIEAKVARVVIGHLDPNPLVNGQGTHRLQAAGIRVDGPVLADEAAEILAPFMTYIRQGRPYVIAKWAQSLDGKLATSSGHSQWISGETSRRRVHRLRARVDAILVGVGTVVTDDPMLTARDVPLRRRAIRVVLDGRLRTPETCRLVRTAHDVETMIMTSAGSARTPKAKRLIDKGVNVVAVRARQGKPAVRGCLEKLRGRELTNLLLEGGPTVLTAFFAAGLVDEALVFTAPKLIGGEGAPGVLASRGVRRVDAALTPRSVATQRSGSDILHRMRFTEPPTAGK